MSNIDKRALREAANAANAASWGNWEPYKPHKGARGYEVKVGVKAVAQHCLKVDSVFIAAANPATVLALLDELEAKETENERMARELLNRSGEIEGLRQRIAELESREINMPPYSFFDFKQGSQFKCGAYCHIDSLNTELSKHGIKITSAACKGGAS
ncbi:ead/Ea22-like family protein [Escherichia coli]|uniref:ead/Ea22-like family protein n=1 Tax=Escherichia coli TaxID=562 RepID=UPI00208E6F19|nr:ead/Ea22-like family protein [Escherichia coli]